MKILVIKKDDLSVTHRYDADAPNQSQFGGMWGDSELTVHVQCSDAMDHEVVKAVDVDGVIILEEDQDLIDAKTERLWVQLRADRDARLAKCDWTQMPDSPLNVQDKASWAAYRQELRDLPENTIDPREIEWPAEPNMEI